MSTQQHGMQPTKSAKISSIDALTDFNWNTQIHRDLDNSHLFALEPTLQQVSKVELLSECLRDGLQGISFYPPVNKMYSYIDDLQAFGIKYATVGIYTGNDNNINLNIKMLLAYMRDYTPSIIPSVLCPCTPASMRWIIECKEVHPKLEAVIFMGTAPFRRFVQQWDLDFIIRQLSTYVSQAVSIGIPVIGGTEHTTQTPPEDLKQILRVYAEQGAYRFTIADTIGVARPRGVARIMHFVRDTLNEIGAQHVQIDWHGHRDTGNALSNAMIAIVSGAQYIHVTARGVGERAGNTALEDIVLNLTNILTEANMPSLWDVSQLLHLLSSYDELVKIFPPEYGTLGKRFNHTTVGIHTDAILKANLLADQVEQSNDVVLAHKLRKMARTIYSAVDPYMIGSSYSVGISPWSGQSSVKLAYLRRGGMLENLSSETIESILSQAKDLGRELTTTELDAFFVETQQS